MKKIPEILKVKKKKNSQEKKQWINKYIDEKQMSNNDLSGESIFLCLIKIQDGCSASI